MTGGYQGFQYVSKFSDSFQGFVSTQEPRHRREVTDDCQCDCREPFEREKAGDQCVRCKSQNMPPVERCRRHLSTSQKMPPQVLPRQQMPKATFSQPYLTKNAYKKD